MNILYICDEYPPCQHGGIGTATQLLARAMVTKNHKVFVAGFYPYYRVAAKEEIDEGVKVFRFHYGSRIRLQFSKRRFLGRLVNIERQFINYTKFLKKIIYENQINIIESPDFSEAFRYSGPRIICFPDFGISMVVKLHGSYSVVNDFTNKRFGNKSIYQKEKNLLYSAKGLIAVSASVKERVKAKFGLMEEISVLNNGIVLNKLPHYKHELCTNNVVFAGTLSEIKGVYSLIRAWPKVIDKVPKAHLMLYGKSSKTSMNEIKQLVSELLISSIEFMGFAKSEDLPGIYSQASCAIFPSYSETFGMAPLEAMAVGCPTIFTKRTSGKEIIENNVDGLLVDPDDVNEIADAIVMLLNNRPAAIALGKRGFEKVRDNFEINIVAEKHLEFYTRFIKE